MAEARWHAVYLLQQGQFWKKRNSSGKRGGGVTPLWRAKWSSECKELRCEGDGGVQDETQTLQIQNLSHVRIECDAVFLSAEGIDLVSGGLGYEEGDSSTFGGVHVLLFRCSSVVKKNCKRNVNVCHAEFRSFCSRSVLIEVPNSISLVYFRWLLQILPLACPSVDGDGFYFLFLYGEMRIPFTTMDNFENTADVL